MEVALHTHPDMLDHRPGDGHAERPERLRAVIEALEDDAGLDLERFEAPLVDFADLALVHPQGFIDAILAAAPRAGRHALDPDTVLSAGSLTAARRAAGAVVAATRAVADGQGTRAFCAVRPPGHHAEPSTAMGFCLFSNIAVAARVAQAAGLKRVAIVDFDVHHGNGTEDIIAGDDRVLMVSLFQHPLYPYSGAAPKGTNMVNVPLPAYTRGGEVREIIEAMWLPALERFKPQMIFISAGFDAHRDDDLGQLGLVEADYEWITLKLKDVAERHAEGRIVSVLEGGYNLHALARSVGVHLRALADL